MQQKQSLDQTIWHMLLPLACTIWQNQGRWDEAEKLQVEVMNATKAKLGSDHLAHALATGMHNLAESGKVG
jgi:hypothetical protein